MIESSIKFSERFKNFNLFCEQFGDFDAFRKPFENKDIGLHKAVATALSHYIGEFSFPTDIHHRDEKISHILGLIDQQQITNTRIRSTKRDRQSKETGATYVNLLRRWKRDPVKLKTPPANDTETLIVFYYFTHFIEGETGKLRDRYWYIIIDTLEPEGSISAKRAEHFSTKEKDIPLVSAKIVETVDYPNGATGRNSKTFFTQKQHAESSAERMLKIHELLTGNRETTALFYRLDYSEKESAFRFSPDDFRHSPDETHLDRILYSLTIVGGMFRRAEVSLQDTLWIRSFVKTVLGNSEVHAYLKWLQSDDQLPDHTDFLDAIYLFERLTRIKTPALSDYCAKAEMTLKNL